MHHLELGLELAYVAPKTLLLALRPAQLGVEEDHLLLVLAKSPLQHIDVLSTLLLHALQLRPKAFDSARVAATCHELRLKNLHLLGLRIKLLGELVAPPPHLGDLSRRVALQALVGGLHLLLRWEGRRDRALEGEWIDAARRN